MKIRNQNFKLTQLICLGLYYGIARHLPVSDMPIIGGGKIRYFLCKRIFKFCGKNVNVEKGAFFGSGIEIEIGDNSGIGINSTIPSNTIIGENVMMGPNCYILDKNHEYSRTDIPMINQGFTDRKKTIIGNDVWIGRNVTIMPGKNIREGSVVAACSCLTKSFPEFSIIGGVPAKLIKTRL